MFGNNENHCRSELLTFGWSRYNSLCYSCVYTGNHETVGGVNAIKWDNIITNTFYEFRV